jgi:hypothetical protein
MGFEVLSTQEQEPVQYGLLRIIGNSNAPTLFLLGGSIQEMLLDAEGNTKLGYLLVNAAPSWNIVSLDLPCHGVWLFDGARTGLQGWYDLAVQGVDFMALFTARAAKVLSDLRSRGIAHASQVAAAGISRGGFAALHCVQATGNGLTPAINSAACISPVTKLKTLWEFAPWTAAEPCPLDPLVLRWYGFHMSISDIDDRVGTDTAAQFCSEVRHAQGNPAYQQVDFHIGQPSIAGEGHSQIIEEPDESAKWLLKRMGL